MKNSVNIMGYPIYSGTLNEMTVHKGTIINTINAYSYVMAESDELFKKALLSSDILLPDGFPIALAGKLTGHNVHKIAGEDLFYHILKFLNSSHGSCFFMGSTWETLRKINDRMQVEFPNVMVSYHSPAFKSEYSFHDVSKIINIINKSTYNVLFIGLSAPKQEKLAYLIRDLVNTEIICSIGAVFDFYAGTVKRPAKIWIALKLEWLVRLIKEPRRLWKRYLIYSPKFVYYFFRYLIKNSLLSLK